MMARVTMLAMHKDGLIVLPPPKWPRPPRRPWCSDPTPSRQRIRRRQLPGDWTERYNVTPVLIETFVETPRYTGALYKASGWTHVGTTQGRGRYDQPHQTRSGRRRTSGSVPSGRDWRRTLNR